MQVTWKIYQQIQSKKQDFTNTCIETKTAKLVKLNNS